MLHSISAAILTCLSCMNTCRADSLIDPLGFKLMPPVFCNKICIVLGSFWDNVSPHLDSDTKRAMSAGGVSVACVSCCFRLEVDC